MTTQERLWGPQFAFDHPVTTGITIAVAVAIAIAFLATLLLRRLGKLSDATYDELKKRIISWAIIAPALVVPILLGAAPTIAMICLLSLLCYREYARATGLFRNRLMSVLVVLSILAITFAVLDHWYAFFMALWPLSAGVIAAAAVLEDQPKGYLQRVALAVFAFALFASGLGHLGYLANDVHYRPILLWLIVSVELNDVFAYLSGKLLGRRKLAPQTSPGKTVGGALGALVLTTALVATLGHFVFAGTVMDHPLHLVTVGIIVSVAGQLGDLMLSSIKRDLGIKDFAATIPGHGGLLDRFDSLLLVGPAVFHYLGYILPGIGLDQPTRIITG